MYWFVSMTKKTFPSRKKKIFFSSARLLTFQHNHVRYMFNGKVITLVDFVTENICMYNIK